MFKDSRTDFDPSPPEGGSVKLRLLVTIEEGQLTTGFCVEHQFLRRYSPLVLLMRIAAVMVGMGWIVVGLAQAEDIPSVPFAVGEKLHYRAMWGPLPVGVASLEVRNIEIIGGRDCYHIVGMAQTTGAGRLLFPVDYTAESWLDVRDLTTRHHRNHRVEGQRVKAEVVIYDYDQGTVTTSNLVKRTTKTIPLKSPTLDVVSALYVLRVRPLQLNREETFLINANADNTLVRVRPEQPRQFEIRPLGTVPAFRIEPLPTLHMISRYQGRLWFWISNDDRRLPLCVIGELPFGSARIVLIQLESPTNASAAKIASAH